MQQFLTIGDDEEGHKLTAEGALKLEARPDCFPSRRPRYCSRLELNSLELAADLPAQLDFGGAGWLSFPPVLGGSLQASISLCLSVSCPSVLNRSLHTVRYPDISLPDRLASFPTVTLSCIASS
jgi:hypothetical protein